MTGLNESVISKAFGLPSEGQQFCDSTVLASGVDIENNRWFVITDGTVQRTAAQEALKPSLNRTKYFTHDDRVFEAISGSKFQMEVVRTNPSGGVQTVIGGSMSYTRVRKNPVSVADFRSEMNDMFVSDPRRDFKEYDAPKLHSEAFRDRLFTFVSYRGESYGWVKGGKIYHRRGSLIMPKLKVNKAVEGATVFYHTHPSKDEPSLSSADDYQFYADLAFAFGIKHFYTIMENRIDHFTFSVKKSKEEDYLKMDEDKLLDDLNAMIDEAEASVTKKHKGNKNMTDEKFYETITRSAVTKMNSRFKQFFTISYKGHAKPGLVRENPGVAGFRHNPPVRISHIHRASQLDELRDTTNNYEHYGANEFGHSHYVYWWIDHHFSATPAHPKARLWKLKEYGLSDEARRKLRAYMSEEVAPGYSKLDILLFLALYHDVGKKREKEEGRHHSIIGAEMFRDEISVELKLPEQVTDTVVHLMMTDVGRKNIDPEVFRTKAGDYLGVAYMLQLADMLAHHPFMYTSYAAEAKEQGLIDKANVDRYKQFAAEQHISNVTKFLNSRVMSNPPPKAVSAYFSGSFDTAIDGDIAEIEFSEWEDPDKKMFYNAQLRMRDPVHGVKVTLFLSSGKFIIYFGKDSNRIEGDATFYDTAMDIYRRMGGILSNFTTGMDYESPPEPDIMVNPRHVDKVHLITISGPSGVGKSTIAKTLAGILDADLIPTVTTRPRRPKEKGNRDRIFIKEKQFKEMIEDGAFVEWKRLKNGFYYGRRYSDFKKPIAVIDVTLKGMKKYRDVFPHTTSIFLDPDVSPEELKKRILRRGGMTPEEAEARANIAAKQIEDAHKMDFDMFVKSKTGGFEEVAKQIAADIEKQNPSTNFFPGEAVEQYPWLRHADLIKQNAPKEGPDLFSHFERWAKLVNMKNKELKAFLDSPLGKVAGLSPQEAKEQGIFSGRVSGRRILKMRAKIGLGGPKDYIKGPRHLEEKWEEALKKWTGPSEDYMNGTTDWDWCMRQVRFNTRHGAFPYNHNAEDKKGPLIKKQKTQNQVSRRLLGLWVWGHDPWRWARKHGVARMPKCPDVPWVGMTEKRKYGKIPVLMKPTKKNPPAFEFSRDPAKRKKRWDKITRSTPEQLRKMAFDMAAEARVRIEIQQEQLPPLRMKNVPKSIADEIEKWYYSSVDRVSFWMGRKNQIAILSRKVVHRPIPKTVKDWILNYSTKHKSKEKAPSISGFNLFRYNPRSGMSAGYDGRWVGLPHWRSGKERKIPAKSFPLMYDAGGGFVEEEVQFQGYYGIIKTLEASYLEKHGIEGYGMGSSLQRAEYYRSFGWLMPQDVSKYAPYVHEGPRSYLLLDEGDVLGWDSSMEFIWRPVYSKPKKNPPVILKGRGDTELLSRFYNPETGEELTGRWFMGGVIDTTQGERPISEVGEEITDVSQFPDGWDRGITQSYNVAKWGDRTVVQERQEYFEKVTINTPVFLLSDPVKPRVRKEPSAFFATIGSRDFSRDEYTIAHPGEITDFKGNAKGFRPAAVYKEVTVNPLSRDNPQTGLPGIGQPPVDPATIQPHLDWPRWPLPPWTKCKHAECKPHARRLKQMVEQTDAVWKPPTKLNEGFYYIQQKDLNNILQSQTYLDGQEAHRQAKIAEAERIRAQHAGTIDDYRTNPSNIPFPVPEEYQEELERRLTEEMTAEGYRPLRVQQDFIDSGGYDDAPSDWSYVQGEYQEFLDEIEAQDWDEAYAEYSDVEGHTAYYLWTNYRIDMPVYTHDHIDKVLFRIRIFEDLFAHYGFDFGPEYLKGGSNYEKVFKVRNALDAAADAQGKPRVTDDDEQLGAVVKQLVAARKARNNPAPMGLEADFEAMKRTAKRNRELEMTEGFDAHGWWKSQKGIIDEKYGKEPVAAASWLMPVFDPDFDPYADPNSIDDFHPDGQPNMHFYNQLMRIPQTDPPTPRKILQIALNIGQGHATGIVDEDYTMSDFIAFDNPRTPGGKKFPTKYLKGLTKLEKMIAEDEIDKGYKYDADDPEAYKFWKSDIKATARGLKIGTSKHRTKYYKMYRKNIDKDYKPAGDSPKEKFLNRIRKETKIKRSILEKIYDKGLAAWRVGHRPGVQQHQWAAGRVYAFAVGADSSTGPGKPDHKLAVEAGVR